MDLNAKLSNAFFTFTLNLQLKTTRINYINLFDVLK